ncbi:MAG: hypothetical protein KGJ80_21450, partial [Chloroflexota bacterium]|nr:hypothetical protein [Chloroflexota bacterium]
MKNLSVAALGLLVAVLSLRGFAAPALPAFAASAVSVTPSFPNPNTKTATASITPTLTATATRTITATATATATPTATVTATLDLSATTPTTTPTITPTPFRYPLSLDAQVLSIDALRARPYGSGPIKITRTVFTGDAYSQYLIEYPSDGLRIIGTMNVPRSIGPFPVVVMDHGYFKPAEY